MPYPPVTVTVPDGGTAVTHTMAWHAETIVLPIIDPSGKPDTTQINVVTLDVLIDGSGTPLRDLEANTMLNSLVYAVQIWQDLAADYAPVQGDLVFDPSQTGVLGTPDVGYA